MFAYATKENRNSASKKQKMDIGICNLKLIAKRAVAVPAKNR